MSGFASGQRRPITGQKYTSAFIPNFTPSPHHNYLIFRPRVIRPNVNGLARATRQPLSRIPAVDQRYYRRQLVDDAPAGPPTPPLFNLCRKPTPAQLLWWDRITNITQLNQDIQRAVSTAASAVWGLQTVNAALSNVLPNLFSMQSNAPSQIEIPVTTKSPESARTSASTDTATEKPGPSPVFYKYDWIDDDPEEITLQDLGVGDKIINYVELAICQKGSRYLQQQVLRGTPAQKNQIFNGLIDSARMLMTDMFGNLVIQSFFENGSKEHGVQLTRLISGNVVALSKHHYGCRVLRKVMELAVDHAPYIIVRELNGHVTQLIEHDNANHVIHTCIECCPSSLIETILSEIKPEVLRISMNSYGCRIIQQILECCSEKQSKLIIHEIFYYFDILAQDQYDSKVVYLGNYVIQHMLEHGNFSDKTRIARMMRGKVVRFSKHKYASNVVEKCVRFCSRAQRYHFLNEIIPENGSTGTLRAMTEDVYANNVIQTILDVTDNRQRKILIDKIRPEMDKFRKLTYGNHIMAKVDMLTGRTKPRSGSPSF